MKKIFLKGIPVFMALVVLLTGCGSNATYQDVLEEYTVKLQEAAPGLVEEFREEAEPVKGDLTALADLSAEKISVLAEIATEGTTKMAEIHLKEKDEESVYQDWAAKLTAVYETEAQKITDAYMEISIG